jgi:hypothetical protein
MSTSANTTVNTAWDSKDVPFSDMWNRSGLKHLIVAHQQTSEYMGTMANVYNPLVYTLPKEVLQPTKAEKAEMAKMIKREKEMMGKMKRLIEAADRDCDELLSELGFGNSWAGGWNDGWGNAAQPQANENEDGADDNAEAN